MAQRSDIAGVLAVLVGVSSVSTRVRAEPNSQAAPPVVAAEPSSEAADGAPAPLREGAFIVSRRGRLADQPEGWTLYFDRDASGRAEPPMIVLPCTNLTGMRRLVEARTATTTFVVSGEVYVYRGRNYILPFNYTVATPLRTEPTGAPAAAAPAPARPDDPSVEDILAGIGDRPASAPPSATSGAIEQSANLRREGELITSRRARMERDRGGAWRLVFDSDAGDPQTPVDAPMRLMPSQTLSRMETFAQNVGEAIPITVSGRVFVYDGRNYLLPTLFVVDFASVAGEVRPAR